MVVNRSILRTVISRLVLGEPAFLENWRRREILKWLVAKGKKHPALVQFLYNHYLELDTARNKALEQLGPLSEEEETSTGT